MVAYLPHITKVLLSFCEFWLGMSKIGKWLKKEYLSLEYNDEYKISNKTALFANAIVI